MSEAPLGHQGAEEPLIREANKRGRKKSWLTANRKWLIGLVLPLLISGSLLTAVFQYLTGRSTTAADRVAECIKIHQMSLAHDKKRTDFTQSHYDETGEYGKTVFASCDWPKRNYSSPEGYSEIAVISAEGPGEDEASGASAIDRIVATCPVIELGYTFGSMGDTERLPPFRTERGSVIDVRGNPWTGKSPYPYPERTEIVVVRNMKVGLDTAACA